MIACLQHEPFYTSGTCFFPEIGIYSGWSALAGSFAAAQPFANPENDIALVFAGECFLAPELAARLRLKDDPAARKHSHWLIQLYEETGAKFFESLNGLFSGLLVDRRRKTAFLFNDRYGIERIYFYENKEETYFASEAKALLRVLPALRAFDEKGVAQFLTFGCTLEWQTLFRGVQLMPGGSLWTFAGASVRKGHYFSASDWASRQPLDESKFESEFKETFKKILPRYFGSASKIGISLTGGLDTRMIMACLPDAAAKPVCYTFSGEKPTMLDSQLAAQVAQACGLEHTNLAIGTDFFSSFATQADNAVYLTDGCFGITGAHEVYLNRKARQLAPVRLTGNFGSEILRGMSTFKPIGLSRDLILSEVRRTIDSVFEGLRGTDGNPISFAVFKEIPWNLFGSLAAGRSQVIFRTPYLDNDLVALAFQAPESLRKSPLVALHLVSEANPVLGKIPTDRGRGGNGRGPAYLSRRLYCDLTFKLDYIYSESLPYWLAPADRLIGSLEGVRILGLHKFLRYRRWFRNELASYIRDSLANARALSLPFFEAASLELIADQHINGQRNYVREINAVLTLEAIDRLILRRYS
ncbi:MAG: hypothetical protein JO279_15545 [Verrucomicrobia bacterium]|nr:hypothetical protein [Verrucomicrobiota bacterium]